MFDNLPDELTPAPTPVKRPSGLTVICILTFVYSGLMFISSLFYSINYYSLPQYFNNMLEVIKNLNISKEALDIEGLKVTFKVFSETNIWFFIFSTILYSVSLTGAILMFRLKKAGFHFYTVSQILLMIMPLVYLAGYKTDFASTAITASFIFLYYTNLRIMK